MLVSHFLDLIPIWVLLIGTILLMAIFIECGFRLGKRAQLNAKKAQTSQVRAIMGAGLGLLAFMLAFTFSTAQTHFEARVQNLAEEARIARNAFMQAGLTDRRSPVATITLALAFSAVIILITDLDRPVMSFFEINNQLLMNLDEYIQSELQLKHFPGD